MDNVNGPTLLVEKLQINRIKNCIRFISNLIVCVFFLTDNSNSVSVGHGIRFADQSQSNLSRFQSNQIGQAGLGIMFLQGRGVKQDYAKAFRQALVALDTVDGNNISIL